MNPRIVPWLAAPLVLAVVVIAFWLWSFATPKRSTDPNAPSMIHVVVEKDGTLRVGSRIVIPPATEEPQAILEALLKERETMRAASQGPWVVSVTFGDVGSCTWRQLQPIMEATAGTRIKDMRLNGLPVDFPECGGCVPEGDGRGTDAKAIAFRRSLPLGVGNDKDVASLRAFSYPMDGEEVLLRCGQNTPVPLLLSVIEWVNSCGGKSRFAPLGTEESRILLDIGMGGTGTGTGAPWLPKKASSSSAPGRVESEE